MVRSSAVLVGVDGSATGAAAAAWAVKEAASRDLPLRLVHAVTATGDGRVDAQDLARAGRIVHNAVTAVEALGAPVRIESQIICGATAPALSAASHDAAMLCLGFTDGASGRHRARRSTAAEIASSARCPVAIIHPAGNHSPGARWVVAESGASPSDDATSTRAVDEALLRGAPLRIVAAWPSRYPDMYDDHAVARKNRLVKARWERWLAPRRRQHPELDAHVTAAPGSILNYLARHRKGIRLAVLSHERADDVAELLAPCVDCEFDILICDAPPGRRHDRTSSSEQSG
ncbi:universal stress protein [Mycolicibacterium gilvum]|uniref:Universal stress family protein n=1 Tax=Mycolicibacterium gilvum (strain DSM 45189 / LMG 24558 / Spyr1) TaxID=278137 RepID=E6TE60_MYCSR|nr:universal stress protein [Mycolicibacterium gilvum]ADU00969.1 universal stress family protein [Mycolicibacterium gilvum Spyr1]